MNISNLKIVLDNGSVLDYTTPDSLGLKFNRITEDFTDPSKRFGDFSYTVSFPQTKNNARIFEFPDGHGRNRIFVGKEYGVSVFSNNQLIIKGLITLLSVDKDSYNCQITSNVKELVDGLKGKKLVDMTALDTIVWNYEKTIVDHINANYSYNETSYQFPLSMYKTFFCSGNTTGSTEQEFGFIYNNDLKSYVKPMNGKNYLYQLHFPPAIYLYNIIQGMFKDIGWSVDGSFFETSDFRKIIIPYTGKVEGYSGAITTGTTNYLNLNRLLPDVDQTEFLKSVIVAFNLYFFIDTTNKIIKFETYKTLFNEYTNSYDITDKVDKDSIEKSYPNADVKISFASKGNTYVAGYDRVFSHSEFYHSGVLNPSYWLNVNNAERKEVNNSTIVGQLNITYNPNAFNNLYNKISGDKEVKLSFSASNYVSMSLRNTTLINGTTNWNTGGYSYRWQPIFTVSIPLLSEQTPFDNKGNDFCSDSGDTYTQGNDPADINYDGGGDLKMYYYYGNFAYDLKTTGVTYTSKYKDWVYLNIATGGTSTVPTFARVRLPIASPFALMTTPQHDALKLYGGANLMGLDLLPNSKGKSELGAESHGLFQTFYSVGSTGNTHSSTKYSLTLGDNEDFQIDNLYSYFHRPKYDLLKNSHLLKCDMFMDENDWREMQIFTPVIYDKEKYQLVSIKNYDVIKNTAEVTLLKKL